MSSYDQRDEIMEVPQNICVLRLSAIGDVCHAVAMVQGIQAAWPQTKITWVIGRVEAGLVGDLAGVQFVVFDKRQGLKGYWRLYKALRGKRFDVLLHMQTALRASIASLFIAAKRRIGFDRARAREGQWLFCNERIAAQDQPHVLLGFMGFAQALGVSVGAPQWSIPLSDQVRAYAMQKLDAGQRHLIVCPAGSRAEKNWLPDRYAALIDYAGSLGFAVSLCGANTALELDLAQNIMQKAQQCCQNLVGQTSLKQLLALLERADVVLAPDTGPLHMAVTVGTPVIGLYGHSNPKRTGPSLYPDYVVEAYHDAVKAQYGKDASALPWGRRAKGAHIMKNIRVDQVKLAFDRVLRDLEAGV